MFAVFEKRWIRNLRLEGAMGFGLHKDLTVSCTRILASRVALMVEDTPASAGDLRDAGSIPGSGRAPGGGHGNPLQYSRLEKPMDRGAWRSVIDL